MRKKSITQKFALALLAFAIAQASAPGYAHAARAHRKVSAAAAKQAAAEAAAPLTGIHVLGDRPAPFALNARSAMMIDADTGAVLYAFNEHDKMQPASLAKIMTCYLVLDALKAGKLTLETEVPISEKAWRLSMDQSVSRMFLEVGQKAAVRDLLYGLMVSSGNDAAVALAEYLAGSTEAFAQMMNDKAKALGLAETHFTNPDGLFEDNEYTTASDMAALGRALLQHHPEALTYTSAKEFTFHKITQPTFNSLMLHDSRVNGIKTGHLPQVGFHLVASATSGGMNLVSAVMGTPSQEKRRDETEKLIDWSFRSFVSYRPDLRKDMAATIPVHDGVAETVAIGPASQAVFTLGRGEEKKVTVAFNPGAKYLEAPVQNGAQVGELAVMLDGKPQSTIPIVTQAAVARAGFFARLRQRVRRMI